MKWEYINDGNPDEEGNYGAVIKNLEGRVVTQYKAKTDRELIEKLLDSQVHANREISRLRKPDTARQPLKVEKKNLTPADRLRLTSDLSDPSRVVEAVEEIVTARQGIAPDKLGADFARKDQEEQDAYYGREAQAFRDDNPDFYPVPQNRDDLFEELKANGWDLTRNNLTIAFNTLQERGNLIPWPTDTSEPQPVYTNGNSTPNGQAPTAPQPRARTIATTGLRNADVSATPPGPAPKRKPYTRADIEKMSRNEFNDKLINEPGFRAIIDSM